MSTRSTTHFRDELDGPSYAIVYRHSDGYPTGAGVDLLKFIEQVKEQCTGTMYGTRFDDSCYLAAKYLAFLTAHFAEYQERQEGEARPLNFGSVGIMDQDPMDIEYRYIVVASASSDEDPETYVQIVNYGGSKTVLMDGEPMPVNFAIAAEELASNA